MNEKISKISRAGTILASAIMGAGLGTSLVTTSLTQDFANETFNQYEARSSGIIQQNSQHLTDKGIYVEQNSGKLVPFEEYLSGFDNSAERERARIDVLEAVGYYSEHTPELQKEHSYQSKDCREEDGCVILEEVIIEDSYHNHDCLNGEKYDFSTGKCEEDYVVLEKIIMGKNQ